MFILESAFEKIVWKMGLNVLTENYLFRRTNVSCGMYKWSHPHKTVGRNYSFMS